MVEIFLKQRITTVDKNSKQLNPFYPAREKQYSCWGNSLVAPQEVKHNYHITSGSASKHASRTVEKCTLVFERSEQC